MKINRLFTYDLLNNGLHTALRSNGATLRKRILNKTLDHLHTKSAIAHPLRRNKHTDKKVAVAAILILKVLGGLPQRTKGDTSALQFAKQGIHIVGRIGCDTFNNNGLDLEINFIHCLGNGRALRGLNAKIERGCGWKRQRRRTNARGVGVAR